MRTALKVVVPIAAFLAVIYLIANILPLLSDKSDGSVAAGTIMLLALVVFLIVVVPWAYRRWYKSSGRLLGMALLAFLLVPSLTGCTRVGPGHVGIKVSNAGDNRGVNDIPLTTGWVFYMPGASTVFEYPTYVQTAKWTASPTEGKKDVDESVTFNSKDNIPVSADVSLSFSLQANKVPAFYVKFRSDDLDTFTDGFLHNVARDAFGDVAGKSYTLDEINSTRKEDFLREVRDRINGQVEPFGVHLEQFGFIGKIRVPDNIQAAMNAKVAAIQTAQQAEIELRTAEAQARKKVATAQGDAQAAIAKAEGDARANQVLTASLTPSLIEWRRLELIDRHWNGSYPLYMGGNQGGAVPLIELPGQDQKK